MQYRAESFRFTGRSQRRSQVSLDGRDRAVRQGSFVNLAVEAAIEPGKRSGQPCVRGLRITVWDVLSWLAAGMTEQEILDDYP